MWDYGEENRCVELAAVSIAMAAVSVLAVALRSYTMSTILKRFVIEDWLAVLTCLLQIGFCVIVVVGVSYGLGAHVEDVPEVNRHKALIFKWAGQVAYIVVSTLVKFVVGIFLLRLCVNNNWQRITIIVLLIVVGLYNIFYVFIAIFQCQPVAFYWYRYTPDAPVTGKCNGHTLATIPTYFAVVIGIAADLILALLPATLIKGANLDKKTKISVCCVLALGSLASVATIARIPYAKQLLSNPDYLYNFTDLAIWSIVECGIAITASSLATLRPLFIKMKILATAHLTGRYGHSRYGSAGLPIQSANTITVISSRARSTKRHTAMTGSTGMTASTAVTGATSGLTSVKEGAEGADGIQVEKEFEMSVMTRETSQDSIDRLEAEVNEVISPGSARRKASYDQFSLASRASGGHARSRPAPLQTSFPASSSASPSTPVHASAGSSSSGGAPRFAGQAASAAAASSNPPSPQPPRRPLDGRMRSPSYDPSPRPAQHPAPFGAPAYGEIGSAHTDATSRSPPPPTPPHHHHHHHHQHAFSDGTIRSQASFAPPHFHLPMRGPAHQSLASNQSDLSISESRGTPTDEAGLSAPPRMLHETTYHGEYAAGGSMPSPPLGSPVSLGGGGRRGRQRSLGGGGGGGGGGSGSPVSLSMSMSTPPPPPPGTGSPAPGAARFHPGFQRQDTIPEVAAGAGGRGAVASSSSSRRGQQRVSAFLADDGDSSSSCGAGSAERLEQEEPEEVPTPGWPPPRHELPSPLRSHPPSSPHGGWV